MKRELQSLELQIYALNESVSTIKSQNEVLVNGMREVSQALEHLKVADKTDVDFVPMKDLTTYAEIKACNIKLTEDKTFYNNMVSDNFCRL